ncbi:ferredoxin-thioredoxin reductase variable chain [Synechococcus sp. CS-1328]|uniref:ferredoxin-thioredoxin reductase variable chain n=1 Tax=Synechococcus sp. CS-1328 TaxID=2847976 RepID=UPI00223AE7BB|nr:ferredoxin-thioredoxin reductase variable chain [Synechococcus sp. CS-1328]MCT0225692.1 ferredoxin-thioredoxin reductase variable chain [Synechococcus sp. CS-1328]
MQPGDPVSVSSSVVVFHHPQHRGQAFDLKGQQGEVVNVLNDWKGRPISPTLPVIVAFGKFRAHFRSDELSPA